VKKKKMKSKSNFSISLSLIVFSLFVRRDFFHFLKSRIFLGLNEIGIFEAGVDSQMYL
jgi:hypothetical protein